MKNKSIVGCLAALVLMFGLDGGGGEDLLFAQSDKPSDKVSVEVEFNASILSADSEGVVDSMTDAGFNEDETKISVSYEDELWGASVALKFGNENLRFLSGGISEMFTSSPLTLDELYGWVKPFGSHFKFTGGIFENADGVADYIDDIDEFDMGVFIPGEGSESFTEPNSTDETNTVLANGFLTDAIFGPVTLQLLLASNYSKESASELASGLLTQMAGQEVEVDAEDRFLRLGGRVIIDAGVGTFSALFRTFQWPMAVINYVELMEGGTNVYPGEKVNWTSFGGYFDLTAVKNLGVSLGYTGMLPATNDSDYDNVLYSGIDLRATWTGIEGFSLSTHNNISFAKGSDKDWSGMLPGDDSSFFTLFNAIGLTKEITEKFSVNALVSNLFSKTDLGDAGKIEYDSLGIAAKFIAKVGEKAEFNIGLRLDVEKTVLDGKFGDADDLVTTFSIPLGIKVNF
jgi:hypothetical protein